MTPTLAPRAPQIMLYFSRPLGSAGMGTATHSSFGFRVEQVRLQGDNGSPDSGDPLQRRELLNWQMSGRSDARIQIGHRVTYNFSRASFGARPPASIPVSAQALRGFPGGAPANATRTAAIRRSEFDVPGAGMRPEPFMGRAGGMRSNTGTSGQLSRGADVFREPSFAHEIASAFGVARINPAQRQSSLPSRPNILRVSAAN